VTGEEARAAVDSRMIELARAKLSVDEMLEDGRISKEDHERLCGKINADVSRIKSEDKGQP